MIEELSVMTEELAAMKVEATARKKLARYSRYLCILDH